MKKVMILALSLSFSFGFHPVSGLAQEAIKEMAPVVFSEPAQNGNPFIFKMTSDGGVLAKPGDVFTEGGHYEKMTLPYLLGTPAPIPYPRWAVRQGWEGRFDIALEILKDGSVGRTKVMRSTGYSLLDQAAEKSVKTWQFHPALENGQPVATCIQMPVIFQIEKD